MIKSNVAINNGEYGVLLFSQKGPKFLPHGKAPTLDEVLENIEDETIHFKLSTPYCGKRKIAYIEHSALADNDSVKKLSSLGFDFTKETYKEFAEAVRLLEEQFEVNGGRPTLAYRSLGWIQHVESDPLTGREDEKLCFRCHKLIGSSQRATYIGKFDIVPAGSFDVWRKMVIKDVIPHPALQLVLIAALSSVVVGLLSLEIPIENVITHLDLPSSKGKSSACYLAASTIGNPFEGTKRRPDRDGKKVDKQSLYQSWGSTDNALIASQAGNYGAVVVLNELGKCTSKNLERVVYDLSEGSDRKRLTTTLETRISEGYATSFISSGEASLLDKCKSKFEGLAIRVLEINSELTKDAAHSRRIKNTCMQNYGFASPMLAKYILEHGGFEMVNWRYNYWKKKLPALFPKTPNVERFIEKFAAIFLTTAWIATEALGIQFDCANLLNFLIDREKVMGTSRSTSLDSYEKLLQEFNVNRDKFIVRTHKSCTGKIAENEYVSAHNGLCWGRITNMAILHPDGRIQTREYEVFPNVVEKILKDSGFENRSTCITAWRNAGVLDAEDDTHAKRKRKIEFNDEPGYSSKVYVFREFADPDEAKIILAEIQSQQEKERKRKLKSKVPTFLLDDDNDGDNTEGGVTIV